MKANPQLSLHLLSTAILAAPILAACGGGGGSTSTVTQPTAVVSPPEPAPTPTEPTTAAPEPVLISDIEFTQAATESGSRPLLLDIYQADTSCDANRPTVLFVHGGGFVSGDKANPNVLALSEAVNERGLNLVSIQYRLFGDAPVLSAPFQAISDEFLPLTPITDQFLLDAAVAATEDTVTALTSTRPT